MDMINNSVLPGSDSFGSLTAHKHAVLYLFAPRQIRDHFKRPIVYNFNSQFIEDTYDVLSDPHGGFRGETFSPNLDKLYNLNSSKSIIMPSASGMEIKTSYLSNSWTFILTVDNDDKGMSFYSPQQCNNRTVYYGYCVDEPINPISHGSTDPTINESAFFVVTHKTIINLTQSYGPYGSRSGQDTVADVDVIPGQTVGTMYQDPLILMTPDNLRKATATEDDGTINSVFGEQFMIQNSPKHDVFNSRLNSPRHHGKKIVNAILSGLDSVRLDSYTGTLSEFANPGYIADMPGGAIGSEVVSGQIDTHMVDGTNEAYVGLPVHEPISLAVIMRTYNPTVQPVYIQQANMFNAIPQHHTSANNIFSSLISSALPGILSNVGLLTLAFQYHSPNRAMQILNVENFVQSTSNETQMRVRAAISLLERDLFDIIISNAGHFDLVCNASCGGDSHITLNLLDSTPHEGVYESNNLLGGIGTQLMGDFNIANGNIMNLGNMISSITSNL